MLQLVHVTLWLACLDMLFGNYNALKVRFLSHSSYISRVYMSLSIIHLVSLFLIHVASLPFVSSIYVHIYVIPLVSLSHLSCISHLTPRVSLSLSSILISHLTPLVSLSLSLIYLVSLI